MIATVDNVIDVYRRATVAEYFEGINWYPSALELARELDPRNPARAAGIIAAFSPQCPWWRNVELARRFYETNGEMAGGHTETFMQKARAIWAGADPAPVLNGRKTVSFYHNILDHISPEFVTIDVHSFEVAVGHIDASAPKILVRKGVYDEFANVYRAAASLFNIPAPAMQAVTWVVWRNEKERAKNARRRLRAA